MRSEPSALRDFTVDRRVWLLSGVAIGIGVCGTGLAVVLLRLIAVSTNLFYYHRLSAAVVSPAGSPLGYWMVEVPVLGGLLVGLMARFGSDKIRGHGIPEAIEAILLHRAKVDPKIAVLKPLSAAIAIGSGGPFGAEGPIIMTGGAVGSLIAQWMRVTDAERTTLLVAGAAAGMSATFATPVAAILLAVELLLFEWRPRSLVPVAIASATAGLLRVYWLGAGPLFPMPAIAGEQGATFAVGALLLGALLGLVAAGMSRMMYAFEDLFERLPVHWMWWPALGGIGVGVGGLFFPRGLGVGYDNIAELLRGSAPLGLIMGILVPKSLMWAFSLGSGTSGGVLAPLLMIGGAVGAMTGHLAHAPAEAQAFWALIGMGSMLAGSLGVPLTAILFSLEVTHCLPALLPLTLGCVGGVPGNGAADAAIDPDGEAEPAGISPDAGVRGGSAGAGAGARGDVAGCGFGGRPAVIFCVRGWDGKGCGGGDGDRWAGGVAGGGSGDEAGVRRDHAAGSAGGEGAVGGAGERAAAAVWVCGSGDRRAQLRGRRTGAIVPNSE